MSQLIFEEIRKKKRDIKTEVKSIEKQQSISSAFSAGSPIKENTPGKNDKFVKFYPSLKSDELGRLLHEHISKQKLKLDQEIKNRSELSIAARTRKNVRENFGYSI